MIPVNQIILDNVLGDCFRACVASIFEMLIKEMPNFWEQTQDAEIFWKLNDDWITRNKGFRCVTFLFEPENRHLVDGILCIAIAKSPRGEVDHAVIWKDGIIHDPHPSNAGLAEEPDTFALFIPCDPLGVINNAS